MRSTMLKAITIFFSVSKYSSSRDFCGLVFSETSSSLCSIDSSLEFKTAKLSTYVWIRSTDGLRTSLNVER
uniref:Uncharacterized protein n=1 Tax=Arundo donax TaxID=35708 RepID=A0A0A9CM96_ARUDO